ncbi:MAG: efflux RND transporter periplasmic adaptor subunit [Bacteroidetes bacterium]|nr:efflux RND transporter periplasmic adaptor subunit [Bacteroidota bacterium]
MKHLAFLTTLLLLFAGCGSNDTSGDAASADATAAEASTAGITLTTEEANTMKLGFSDVTISETQKTISVPARVIEDPDQVATVSALIEGRIGRVLARQGQSVSAGQVLATVVSMDLGNMIADLLRSESDMRTAEAAVTRLRGLSTSDAVSKKQLMEAENAYAGAQASAAAALQRCKAAGMNSEDIAALRKNPSAYEPELKLRAPIGGVISMRNASTGMPVAPGVELFTLLGTATATVEGSVFEDDFAALATTQQAVFTTTAYPGKSFSGTISYVAPTVDDASHALPVRVRLANSGGLLKPNLYGRLDIRTTARDSVLSVPSDAIVYDGSERYLFVVAGENSYIYRRVETGRDFDDAVEITRGVQAGERVVSSGVFHLKSRYKLSLSAEEE